MAPQFSTEQRNFRIH